MIIGNIRLQGIPSHLPAALRSALEYFSTADLASLPTGKARFPAIDEEDAYFIVQRYDSRAASDCIPERHRRFADIQLVVKGREAIGWAPYSAVSPIKAPYEPVKDVELFLEARGERFVHLFEGDYAILGTDDVHRPCCLIEAPEPVFKIVGKVRAELLG